MKIKIIVGILAVILGGLFVFTQIDASENRTTNYDMQTIRADIENGGQLLDVRTNGEYAQGHIDGAVNLSLQDIQAGRVPGSEKDKPLYLYCRSGSRSSDATKILQSAGFQYIIDLGAMTKVQLIGGTIKT